MANVNNIHKDNVKGKFYCTDPDDDDGEGCIACSVCYMGAPDFFAEDDMGNAYVKKQPETAEDIELCKEQLDACPVCSIGDNGPE
jgi:ferredoxin